MLKEILSYVFILSFPAGNDFNFAPSKYVMFLLLLCLWVPLLLTILCCIFIIQFIIAKDPIIVFVNFLKPKESVLNGNQVAIRICERLVPLYWCTFESLISFGFNH